MTAAACIENLVGSVNDHVVLASSARPVDLLKKLEQAIDALNALSRRFVSDAHHADELAARLETEDIQGELNEERFIPPLDEVQSALRNFRLELNAAEKEAYKDDKIRSDDGLVEAITTASEAVETIFDSLEHLRWMIMEHNAEMDRHEPVLLTSDDDIKRYFAVNK